MLAEVADSQRVTDWPLSACDTAMSASCMSVRRTWTEGFSAACMALPDADILGALDRLGDPKGARGLTHSLLRIRYWTALRSFAYLSEQPMESISRERTPFSFWREHRIRKERFFHSTWQDPYPHRHSTGLIDRAPPQQIRPDKLNPNTHCDGECGTDIHADLSHKSIGHDPRNPPGLTSLDSSSPMRSTTSE